MAKITLGALVIEGSVAELKQMGVKITFYEAEIGRKPEEFKKGDIVRVTADDPCGSGHKKGTIGEILERASDWSVRVGGGEGGWLDPTRFAELVTPVEARFDR